MKNFSAIVFASAIFIGSGTSFAQSTIPGTGNATVVAPTAATGRSTENLSLTNGSRTTLSVGNSTSFGASANVSASEGLTAISRSALIPSTVSIESTIGTGTTAGLTKINISNLTSKGGGTVIPGTGGGIGDGTQINATDGQFASGDATIEGMGANVRMTIGSDQNSQASFFATVHPNALKGSPACGPSNSTACSYELNKLVSGNAGANANLSTTTNIDIQANSFVQTFGQAF